MNYGVTTRLNQHNRRLLTNTRADRSRNGPVPDTFRRRSRVRHVSRELPIGSNMADGVGVGRRRRLRRGPTFRGCGCYPNVWDRRCTERLPVGATEPDV